MDACLLDVLHDAADDDPFAVTQGIDVDLDAATLASRLEALPARAIPYKRGALAKYARLVSSASAGAITH